jgi:CHAT domain-containing protein
MAGAEYIMMSLWQVPDKETAEFMQLFYRNLFKEKKIPVAFHKTQLQMQKKYDPYYWAAFVLIN